MRVLIVSQFYPPEPFHRLIGVTTHMLERGHEVRVITTFPTFPAGKLYDGYRMRPYARTHELGADVRRVPSIPYRGVGIVGRLVSYGSFAIAAAVALLFERKPDVVYVYHPPSTVGVVAAAYCRARRVPLVYDIQDLWPEAIVATGAITADSSIARVLRAIQRWVYRRSAGISVLSDRMRDTVVANGAAPDAVRVVPNWADPDIYFPQDGAPVRAERGWGDRFVAMVAGNLSTTHELDHVVAAAAFAPDVLFVFLGRGAARDGLMAQARAAGIDNVEFIDRVEPAAEAARLINSADVMVVHLPIGDGAEFSVPHRVYSYMLCARPIVVATDGSLVDLVDETGCGWVCPPRDAEALGTMLAKLALDPDECRARGEAGNAFVNGPLARDRRLDELEALLCDVV